MHVVVVEAQTTEWRVETGGRVEGGHTGHDVRGVGELLIVAGVWAETLDVAPAVHALAAGCAWGAAGLSDSGHNAIVDRFVVAADERR